VEPVDPYEKTLDGKPYSVLFYGNGPAYTEPRQNLSDVDMGKVWIFNYFYFADAFFKKT
jgi:hypothetical protein